MLPTEYPAILRRAQKKLRHFAGLGLLAATLATPLAGRAQGVGIGTPTPDASAALDVVATTKGLLVPRLTQAQRLALGTGSIPAPAKGLLVFQTDGAQPGFWFNAGPPAAPAWTFLNPTGDNLGNHTATQNLNLGGNALTGTGGSLIGVGVGVRADGGLNLGQNSGGNVLLGFQAGKALTSGTQNLMLGANSGPATTTGSNNLFLGGGSGGANVGGSNNLFLGVNSGTANVGGNFNVFAGSSSGAANTSGSSNLFVGWVSGFNNTSGGSNIFLGQASGYNNTSASNNLFLGYASGYSNATGSDNLFSGSYSGYSNTSGSDNLFSGSYSGNANTTGTGNLFLGHYSGFQSSTGNYNLFLGYNSGYANSIGAQNVFTGNSSGTANTTGSNNVFYGANSGLNNTTGSNNLALGTGADFPSGSVLTNATAIGYNAVASASNKVRLGNTSVTVIEGQVPFSNPSDARFKYQVQANVPGLRFITKLRPVTYRFDAGKLDAFTRTGVLAPGFAPDAAAPVQSGFLAQEVEQAAKAVGFEFDGVHRPATPRDHYSIAYGQLVVPLVQAVQEQQAQIDALTAQNTALQTQLAGDHAALLDLQAQLARLLGNGTQARK